MIHATGIFFAFSGVKSKKYEAKNPTCFAFFVFNVLRCCLMDSPMDSRVALCSWASHFTFTAPSPSPPQLSTQVYHESTGEFNVGVEPCDKLATHLEGRRNPVPSSYVNERCPQAVWDPFPQWNLYHIVALLAYLPLLWDNPVWRILLQRYQPKTRWKIPLDRLLKEKKL